MADNNDITLTVFGREVFTRRWTEDEGYRWVHACERLFMEIETDSEGGETWHLFIGDPEVESSAGPTASGDLHELNYQAAKEELLKQLEEERQALGRIIRQARK